MNWKESIFVRYWNYLKTWRLHRETVKQLNRLTDKELEDIGLTRDSIDRMIWLEVDKRMKPRAGACNDERVP